MGMIGSYLRTNEETVKKIQQGEIEFWDLLNDDSYDNYIIDIDKTWHALHFTLTGKVWAGGGSEFDDLVLGGESITDSEKEEFPILLIRPERVKELAEALEKLTEQEFREKFSMKKMVENEIYPLYEEEDEDDFFEYVSGYFIELKKFMKIASDEGQAVIFYIS